MHPQALRPAQDTAPRQVQRTLVPRFSYYYGNLMIIVIFILFSITLPGCSGQTLDKSATDSLASLPTGEDWLNHARHDLLDFWTPEALAKTPNGSFSTLRYHTGEIVDPDSLKYNWAEYFTQHPEEKDELYTQFVRMVSRETYLYGVGFHLTGEEKYLRLAKAGVDYLFNHCRDENGFFYSWLIHGRGGPAPEHRTSQDMSYALLGPAFYYYLTRDPDVLARVLETKDYIFDYYGGENWQHLAWIKEDVNLNPYYNHTSDQQELVGQLDQINAYMLLLTPLLAEPHHSTWKRDIKKLGEVIRRDYYNPETNLFWGTIAPVEKKGFDGNTDFGHTIKSFWMLYLIGRQLDEPGFVDFALANAPRTIAEAFLPDVGRWASKKDEQGQIVRECFWWQAAELDQMTATLCLVDSTYLKYLVPAYRSWFDDLVDHENGEVFFMANDRGEHDPFMPKAMLWKNGFHSLEHALVSYITTQALRQEAITLYYAFVEKPAEESIQPYYYSGDIQEIAVVDSTRSFYKVVFSGLK